MCEDVLVYVHISVSRLNYGWSCMSYTNDRPRAHACCCAPAFLYSASVCGNFRCTRRCVSKSLVVLHLCVVLVDPRLLRRADACTLAGLRRLFYLPRCVSIHAYVYSPFFLAIQPEKRRGMKCESLQTGHGFHCSSWSYTEAMGRNWF